MLHDPPSRPSVPDPTRHRRRAAASGALLALVVTGAPSPAGATVVGDDLTTYTVEGTALTVVVDDPSASSSTDEHIPSDREDVLTFVEVDGELHLLPEAVALGTPSGTGVVVSVAAPAGLEAEEALEAATAPSAAVAETLGAPEPGRTDEVGATVVAVEPRPGPAATSVRTAAATLGTHTLTVLPVNFGAPDAATPSHWTRMAQETADLWREQTGGALTVVPDVRGWKTVTDPGTCDLDGIFAAARAAHGVAAPTATRHVLVYFPARADCGGWAGMASIGGGYIWVQGEPWGDVAAHELGHNLGLGHANTLRCTSGGARVALSGSCTAREYEDLADVMGGARRMVPGSLNTAFADTLGLAVTHHANATTAVTRTLAPLASVGELRAVRVDSPQGRVYLDYRPGVGRDVRVEAWSGVQAHLRVVDDFGIPDTFLLDLQPTRPAFSTPQLPVGGSWTVPGTGVRVALLSQGSTARLRVEGASAGADQRYITKVYRDLFGREVDPEGLRTWTTALAQGTPRVAVANSITYSTEYRTRLIGESYRRFLARSPERAGVEFWLGEMTRGRTIQEMEGGFLASEEYYLQAGRSDATWVRRLYSHVLGRAASSAEVAHWVAESRSRGRYHVAMGFLLSTEHLTTVVDGYYRDLLDRGIDPTGRAHWVRAIQTGTRTEAIIGGIVSSDEYYGRP